QRHLSASTKFAHVESRLCGHKPPSKTVFYMSVNLCVRTHVCRSVVVGLMGDSSDAACQRAFMDSSGQCLMKVLHTHRVMNTRSVWSGRKGVSASVTLPHRLQHRLGILQVSGIKALREPPVDWCQEVISFLTFPLLLPQASQAG